MTTIQERIITCARRWRENATATNCQALKNVVDEYEETVNPDPWKLLEEVAYEYQSETMDKIREALRHRSGTKIREALRHRSGTRY